MRLTSFNRRQVRFFRAVLSGFLAFLMSFSPVLPSFNPLAIWGVLSSRAAVNTWTGEGMDNFWSTPQNWSEQRVPDANDIATFDDRAEKGAVIDTDISIAGMNITQAYENTVEVRSGKRVTIGASGFRQSGGYFIGGTAPMDVFGSVSITSGRFIAPSGNLNIKNNLVVLTDDFQHNNGTVILNGIEQVVFGSITFYNFVKIAEVPQTLEWQAGKTYVFEGSLKIKGSSLGVLSIRSDKRNQPAMFEPRGAVDTEYLEVSDNINISIKDINCLNDCRDAGNNTGWVFPDSEALPLVTLAERVKRIAGMTSEGNDQDFDMARIGKDGESSPSNSKTDFSADEEVAFSIKISSDKKVKIEAADDEQIKSLSGKAEEIVTPIKKEEKQDPERHAPLSFNWLIPTVQAEEQEKGLKVKTAEVLDVSGNVVDIEPVIKEDQEQVLIHVPQPNRGFHPGKYQLRLLLQDSRSEKNDTGIDGDEIVVTQDFTWGVLAMNFSQSTYVSQEDVIIGMAVLDDLGRTICDADLTLEIKRDNVLIEQFNDEKITVSPECIDKFVTDEPDYKTIFTPAEPGEYHVELTAETAKGIRAMQRTFEVKEEAPFIVSRFSEEAKTSMRIYPPADYTVRLKVTANEDFTGDIVETVPGSFSIKDISNDGQLFESAEEEIYQQIVWPNSTLQAGQTVELSYVYKAPNISPQFYTLGPIDLTTFQTEEDSSEIVWSEPRTWQIAADALVDISGTIYSDEGTTPLTGVAVALLVNGGSKQTTTSDGSNGTYTFTDVDVNAGDIITIFLDTDGTVNNGVTVTVGAGVNITGLNVYLDHLIVRHDNAGSLTNTDLAAANSGESDSDIDNIYTVSSGILDVKDGKHFFIPANHSFTPGGDIRVGGSLNAQGTFEAGEYNVMLTGSGEETITSTSNTFNNVTLNDGLVGYWKFDEGTGTTAYDSSGYGNDGTLVNGPTWTTDTTDVSFNNPYALEFDGVDDYVDVGDTGNLSGSSEVTISAWVYPRAISTNTVIWRGINTVTRAYSIYLISPDEIRFRLNTSSTGAASVALDTTNSPIGSLNTWYHIVTTYSNLDNTMRIYVDGTEKATGVSASGTLHDSANARLIGDVSSGGFSFNGSLDDIRIYNRTLSSEEITALSGGNQPATGLGTYTLTDNLDISGDLTLNSGTFDISGDNHNIEIGGSWLNHGGIFNQRAGNVNMAGIRDSALLSGRQSFNNLTVNKEDGLVGYWKLDEGTGTTANDSSGNDNHGMLVNGPTWTTDTPDVSFSNSYALEFDGVGKYSESSYPPEITDGDVTVSMWTKKIASHTSVRSIVSIMKGSSPIVLAYYNGGTHLRVRGQFGESETTNPIDHFQWTHYVFVSRPDTVADIYVNGVVNSNARSTALTPFSNGDKVWLNAGFGGGFQVHQKIDDVRIYNRALSAEEIANLAGGNALGVRLQDDLYINETLTQTAGTLDVSSNNRNIYTGTLNQTGGILEAQSGRITVDHSSNQNLNLASSINNLDIGSSVKQGLVGHWNLDEGTGTTAFDSSGSNNDGTLVNGPTWTTETPDVAFSNPYALEFDGADDYVDTNESKDYNFTSENFSASAWINVYILSGNKNRILSNGANLINGWELTVNPSTQEVDFQTHQSDTRQVTTSNAISLNKWMHVAVTRNGSVVNIYINGADDTNSTEAHIDPVAVSRNLIIGGYGFAPASTLNNFNGFLDDIRIYNRALSPQEIQHLASGGHKYTNSDTATFALTNNLDLTSDLNINQGALDASPNNHNITNQGNWNNYVGNSGFEARQGTVTLNGANQTIKGNNTFYNLSASGGTSRTLTFESGKTQTISANGNLTLQGAANNLLTLTPLTPASPWNLNVHDTVTQNITYTDTSYSDASSGNRIAAGGGTNIDSGNNINWCFLVCVLGGSIFSDQGTTPLTNKNIRIAINGVDHATTATSDVANGTYAFNDVNILSDDVVTAYLDNETEKAVTVTVADGADILDLDLYQDYLIARHDNAGSLTNTNLNTAVVSAETDITDIYTVDDGILNTKDGKHFFIPQGHIFAPGNNINAGGSFTANGTFTAGAHEVAFTGSSNETIDAGGNSFNDVTVGSIGDHTTEDGLVGYWKFDEGTGTTANDSSGNGNHGTLVNGPTWTTDTADVSFSNTYALEFDGVDDYVDTTDISLGKLTFAAWARIPNGASNDRKAIGGKYDNTTNKRSFAFGSLSAFNNNAMIAISDQGSNFEIYVASAGDMADGLWHHWTMTWDGTNAKAYKDGVEMSLSLTSSSGDPVSGDLFPSDINMRIGAIVNSSSEPNHFNGLLDDIRIYNRALSAEEISHLATGKHSHGGYGGATYTLSSNLDISGDLALDYGTLDVSEDNRTIDLVGNWTKNSGGAFTSRSGTVSFNGTNQTILGDNTFYNFTKSNPGTLTFGSNQTQTIQNSLTLSGQDADNRIFLNSASPGTQWLIGPQGGINIGWLHVVDSNNIGNAIAECAGNIVDGGNNTNWTFSMAELTQNDWRWYYDNDEQTPAAPWGTPPLGQNSMISVVPAGLNPPRRADELRMRINTTVGGSCEMFEEQQAFKVQYTAAVDCADEGNTWTDVDDGGAGGIWRYGESNISDSGTLSELLLTGSNVLGRYYKSKAGAKNPFHAALGDVVEWDFHLEHNGAEAAKMYCFRLVNDTGDELHAYGGGSFPKLETKPDTSQLLRGGDVFIDGVQKGKTWAD